LSYFSKLKENKFSVGKRIIMSVQELQFERFRPQEAPDELWEKLIDIQLISFKETNPDDPPPPRDLLHKHIASFEENPFFMPEMYLIRQSDEAIVGRLVMAFPRPDTAEYDDQKHMGFVIPFVLPNYRKQGMGKMLLKKAVTTFQKRGLTLIQGDTNSDVGRTFAENLGSTVGLEARVNRLYTQDIDWDLVESWCNQCAQANPDVTIEMFEGLPDEADIEALAQ
jgi:GNAT superfamily N-acetyltransferase